MADDGSPPDQRDGPIRGLLVDMDGVIASGDHPIPGAPEAIRRLRKHRIPYCILTNATRRSRNSLYLRLEAMGIPTAGACLFSPAAAAIRYIEDHGFSRCHLLVTPDLLEEFSGSGIPDTPHHSDCVVIGDVGDRLSYSSLNMAFRNLTEGASLIALERDRRWMGADGLMLAAGPFVTALEYASGVRAVLLGKPSPHFFSLALSVLGLAPGEVAMIGDDIESDIRGAMECGIRGVLVRTGKFRPELLESGIKPDLVIDSIAALDEVFSRYGTPYEW